MQQWKIHRNVQVFYSSFNYNIFFPDEAPDLLVWEELGRIQIQPRLYQIVEVCEKINDAQPYLLRLCYTSPKVPHKVLVHYLGDTRPYLIKECEIVIDEYTGEPAYITKGLCKGYSLDM